MQIILTKREKEAFDDMLHTLDPELVNVLLNEFEKNCCYTSFEYEGDSILVVDSGYTRFQFNKYGELFCKFINKLIEFADMMNLYNEEEKELVRRIKQKRSGIAPKKYKNSSFIKHLINGDSNDPYRAKYHSKLDRLIEKEGGNEDAGN